MICRISGQLENLIEGKAILLVEPHLAYEVLVPAFTMARLGGSMDQAITLHTIYHIEGSSQGTSFTPRLFGFLSPEDKAFFELFTTVKGIGPRKALKALAMDSRQIAMAIADRDAKMLQSLPEIGKRMAETIIATLHGKVDGFLASVAVNEPTISVSASGKTTPVESSDPSRRAAREALEVLIQLGENSADAVQWVDRAVASDPSLDDAQLILNEVFKMRGQ